MTIPEDQAERERRMRVADKFTENKPVRPPGTMAPWPVKKDPGAKKEEK